MVVVQSQKREAEEKGAREAEQTATCLHILHGPINFGMPKKVRVERGCHVTNELHEVVV